MSEYPRMYEMDGVYNRVRRDGKYMNVCFSDLTVDEQRVFLDTLSEPGLKRMCMALAQSLRSIGEEIYREDPMQEENPAPFGYNADGTHNEREAEVVRHVFTKYLEYFRNPPQELIDEAHAWAESEGMTLNDEEAQDMARARIAAYIAKEVNEKFPGLKYRKAEPPKGTYPTGLKYPSRPFKSEEIIDRDLYAQVQELITHA